MPPKRRKLLEELARTHPELDNPEDEIAAGHVLVDGSFITNPSSLVSAGASITLKRDAPLRGEAKLQAALELFDVQVPGKVALDAGAAAGGFTKVLVEHGARKVYAVDAGYGQLVGSLRQDPRVVNLEGVNLGELNRELIPDSLDLITLDLSYLALTNAVSQLDSINIAQRCDLIALVKPMFELGLASAPTDSESVRVAMERAASAFEAHGWSVVGQAESPVEGGKGAREGLIHARRR